MKKSKVIGLFLSVAMLICSAAPIVSAENDDGLITARKMYCSNCGSSWDSASVCYEDMTFWEDGEHTGFSGILPVTCHMDLYVSRGAEICTKCLYVIETYGLHDCREYHINCNKGDYRVCTMRYRISDF